MNSSEFVVKNPPALRFMKAGDFNIYYGNEEAARDIYEEVFIQKVYDFKTDKEKPVIIDAGSNIGIAMLFFKQRYPLSKIFCFEPDPHAFAILGKNVNANYIKNIFLVNAALSKNTGIAPLYGEVFGPEADSRGNSMVSAWGRQRETASHVLVNTRQLSNYIKEPVDFLKMDIEGVEQEVLEELGDKLGFVKEMVIEIHETEGTLIHNHIGKIKSLLEGHGFAVTTKAIFINDILPKEIQPWIQKVRPTFSILSAKRL